MKSLRRGFTLIELLVVIAVIGVLAAVLLVAINPIQKINQGNDAKVKSDIGQLMTAAAVFATNNGGGYPAAMADMIGPTNDLQVALTPPAGYVPNTYTWTAQTAAGGACTTAARTCAKISIAGTIKAPVTAGNAVWCGRSAAGSAGEVVAFGNCTP